MTKVKTAFFYRGNHLATKWQPRIGEYRKVQFSLGEGKRKRKRPRPFTNQKQKECSFWKNTENAPTVTKKCFQAMSLTMVRNIFVTMNAYTLGIQKKNTMNCAKRTGHIGRFGKTKNKKEKNNGRHYENG